MVFVVFYLANVLCMFVASVYMLIALIKMKKFLTERGLERQISPIRMMIHSLAFLIYVGLFFLVTLLTRILSLEELFFFHWFVCIVAGFLAYICLFVVLWHLGTSSRDGRATSVLTSTTGNSQKLREDSILQYVGCKPPQEVEFTDSSESAMQQHRKSQVESLMNLAETFDKRLWSQFIVPDNSEQASPKRSQSQIVTKQDRHETLSTNQSVDELW